jgi:hypothetical protein
MSVELQTPSKVAASALSSISLNASKSVTPASDVMAKLKAKAAEAQAAKPVVEEVKVDAIEECRTRFVGDLECEEKDEPLLQESNSRFVLFPIKYREVSEFSRIQRFYLPLADSFRSGKCTSRPRLRSGLPRRLTSPRTCTTGRTSSTTTSVTSLSTSLPSSLL